MKLTRSRRLNLAVDEMGRERTVDVVIEVVEARVDDDKIARFEAARGSGLRKYDTDGPFPNRSNRSCGSQIPAANGSFRR